MFIIIIQKSVRIWLPSVAGATAKVAVGVVNAVAAEYPAPTAPPDRWQMRERSGCGSILSLGSVASQPPHRLTPYLMERLSPTSPVISSFSSVDDSAPGSNIPIPALDEPLVVLPSFTSVAEPTFSWGQVDADSFSHSLDASYAEIVHWRKNCFKVPAGNSGKSFVSEVARLFRAFAEKSALESVALKAVTVLAILTLQKPFRSSKTKDHVTCLVRRLALWKDGNLNDLVLEGRSIQKRLPRDRQSSNNQQLARSFSNLMFACNTKAALRLITEQNKGDVLSLDDTVNLPNTSVKTVRELLIEKHPPCRPAIKEILIPTEAPPQVHPIIFEAIDVSAIRSASLRTQGAAGPSGLDAHCWRRLCTSFKEASNDLCHSLAKVAVRICTSYVDPKSISPLLARRLIAINKNPGIRPIGICETARRIIAITVLTIVGEDILDAAGCSQLCAGQPSGTEAAVHAVRFAFQEEDAEAILLVDASNAFNALNRECALHNIQRVCPPLATILINTYREPSELFADGNIIWSQEGTTQGDPLAMAMYALATIPLIQSLKSKILQIWYADDASAVGKIASLRNWWNRLSLLGPSCIQDMAHHQTTAFRGGSVLLLRYRSKHHHRRATISRCPNRY